MESKKNSTRTEREDILFEQIAEVLEGYETGDSILVVRMHDMEDGKGNFQTRVASGVISEHLPLMKQTFEKIIRQGMETVAKQDPYTAARLMASIMMHDQE